MDENLKANLKNRSIWERAIYLLIFAVLFHFVEVGMWALIVFQFLGVLLTGKRNERILHFSSVLAQYVSQIILFLTFHTDERPFPFGELPGGK